MDEKVSSNRSNGDDSIQLRGEASPVQPSQNPSDLNFENDNGQLEANEFKKKRGGEALVFVFDNDDKNALQNPFGKKPPLRSKATA